MLQVTILTHKLCLVHPDLVRCIEPVPEDLDMDFLRISSYVGTQSSGNSTMAMQSQLPIKGRHVLLVRSADVRMQSISEHASIDEMLEDVTWLSIAKLASSAHSCTGMLQKSKSAIQTPMVMPSCLRCNLSICTVTLTPCLPKQRRKASLHC